MRNTKIHSLSIYTTTLCNLKCVGCCAGTQSKNNITIEEIRGLRKFIPEVDTINITGGEPTLHKHFRDIMAEIFKMNYKTITLNTNGYNLMKYIDMMDNFSRIIISHYNENSYEGVIPNTSTIKEFTEAYKGNTPVAIRDIVMIEDNKLEGMCGRGNNGVASYFKGKIYGCCVSAGMDTGIGVPLDENWKESALKVPLPCKDCVFAV